MEDFQMHRIYCFRRKKEFRTLDLHLTLCEADLD